MWVTKLLISPVKKGFFAQKRPNLAQNWHFWSIRARPCRLIQWHHHHPHPIQIRQSRVVAISCQVSRAHLCAYMATPIQFYTVVCVVILALAVHCNIEHVLPHMARRANRKCVQQNLVHCPICHIEHSSRQYVIRRKKRYLPEVIGTKIFPISEDG